MATEKKPKSRAHKTSLHQHGAGGKGEPLSDLQKILISNGGMAHQYLRGTSQRFRFATPKRKGGKGRSAD